MKQLPLDERNRMCKSIIFASALGEKLQFKNIRDATQSITKLNEHSKMNQSLIRKQQINSIAEAADSQAY